MKTTPILQAIFGLLVALPATAGQSGTTTSPDQVPEGLGKSDWQSIRAAHEGWKHRFHAVEGGWQANNPGQQWTTHFDGRGFLATPKDANWTWGLQFQSYGFAGNLIEVSGTPEVRAGEQRLSYQWDDNVEEWFVNDQRGLEHGFIIKERPAGGKIGEPLVFTMTTVGGLRPTLSADAQTVHFRDAASAPVLNYSGLKVWDAEGTMLSSRFERVGEARFRIVVEEAGAAYPIVIDPIAQLAYLKASNTGADDSFGGSVAVSGDTVVVGAPDEDSSTTGVNSTPNNSAADSGAAYVFTRSGGAWSQQAYLKASNTGANDRFGGSVAVSGDTVVVGAPDEDSSTTGVNGAPDEGAIASGAAYVFTRSGTIWSQQAYLKASNTGSDDRFGVSVSASGSTVVVGAMYEDSSTTGVNSTPNEGAGASGAAYVFNRSGTTWSQQAYLKASNTGATDFFGGSVAVSGDTVVVGSRSEDSNTTGVNSTPNNSAADSGAAYVFTRSGGTWTQQAYLKASNTGASDQFGCAVSVSGDMIVVGAEAEDSSTTGVNSTPNEGAGASGAAYVFNRSGTTWSQQAYLKASNTGPVDYFGHSVAVSGNTVVVGAYQENSSTTGVNSTPDEGAGDSGAAYVFTGSSTTWSQQAYLKASNTGMGDWFGVSIAVSGDVVVVGAKDEDSSTAGVNSAPDNSAFDAGAAYVFDLNAVLPTPEIAIQQAGSDLASSATKALGSAAVGSILDLAFTISNTGEAELTLDGSPRVAVSGSSDFTVTSQPANSTVLPGGSDTFTVCFTPTGNGPKSATLSIANNDDDENPFVINLTGTATTASALFTSTITSGSSLTGNDTLPNATPFGDGVENLLKYAFNMNLAGPDASTLPPGTGTSGLPSITTPEGSPPATLRFEFIRRKGSGLVYTPQKSTTLAGPSWSPLIAAPVVTSIDDQWERVVYTEAPDPVPVSACFGRVSVSLP
jgi:hypothetical protein